jgi:hypothetical protein
MLKTGPVATVGTALSLSSDNLASRDEPQQNVKLRNYYVVCLCGKCLLAF